MPASPRLQALLRAKEENEIGNFLSAVLEAQDEIGGIEAERYMEIMDRSPYSTGVPVRVGYEDDDQIFFKPEQLRSKNAEFDPDKIDDPFLLSGLLRTVQSRVA